MLSWLRFELKTENIEKKNYSPGTHFWLLGSSLDPVRSTAAPSSFPHGRYRLFSSFSRSQNDPSGDSP